jgi:tetratricopeptide (TPR) repeat protein
MRPSTSRGLRLTVSVALVAAVVGMSWLGVARRQRMLRREEPGAPAGTLQGMEDAHAAAGVVTTDLSAVESSFHARSQELRAVVEAAPDSVGPRLELARFLHDGHRPEDAVEHYLAAIATAPDSAQPYYDLALAYADLARWEDAAAILGDRLERVPDDVIAMYDLGAVLANQGDSTAARLWWNQILAMPSDPETRNRTVRALAQLGGRDPP